MWLDGIDISAATRILPRGSLLPIPAPGAMPGGTRSRGAARVAPGRAEHPALPCGAVEGRGAATLRSLHARFLGSCKGDEEGVRRQK